MQEFTVYPPSKDLIFLMTYFLTQIAWKWKFDIIKGFFIIHLYSFVCSQGVWLLTHIINNIYDSKEKTFVIMSDDVGSIKKFRNQSIE